MLPILTLLGLQICTCINQPKLPPTHASHLEGVPVSRYMETLSSFNNTRLTACHNRFVNLKIISQIRPKVSLFETDVCRMLEHMRGSGLHFRTRSTRGRNHMLVFVEPCLADRRAHRKYWLSEWGHRVISLVGCAKRCIAATISAAERGTWATANKHGVIPRMSTATGTV